MSDELQLENATASFGSLRVAAFESRRADDMRRLIERFGGQAIVAPSMREVPLAENPDAVDFANRLISGQIDIVLLLTGVGTRMLVKQIERHVDRQRFLDALSDVTTIVRGPKPAAALKELGIEPKYRVPEPNTWSEVLQTIDAHVSVSQQTVALQEYGKPNVSLVAGLEARGAQVRQLKVYEWDLPLDTGPLENCLKELAAGRVDVALFTSAHQVVNVLRMSERLGIADAVRDALNHRTVVASIGPTTSEMLHGCDLPADLMPDHPKMGHLVMSAAEAAPGLVRRKRGAAARPPAAAHPQAADPDNRPAWWNNPLMRACRLEPNERTPIWLMRQAGRYLPEYREVRRQHTFLDLCKSPKLCAEVMLATVERLDVDAAIIFSDLLPMLEPMGIELEYAHGEGPVIHNPIRTAEEVDELLELEDLDPLEFVFETVRRTREGLAADKPVIGFAGAPFTLASYVIEGGASRNFSHTKRLMNTQPQAFHELLARIARAVVRYLNAQIAAGAQVVQVFDSWAGCLGPDDYRRHALPHTRAVAEGLTPGVPLVNFSTGNPALVPLVAEAGGAVIGVDWRVRLDDAWQQIGPQRGIQGNLDPSMLLAGAADVRRGAEDVLRQAAGRPGHIFNLGHGVLPETPVENVLALVETVKHWRA